MILSILNSLFRAFFSLLLITPLTYFINTNQVGTVSYNNSALPLLAEHQISLGDRYPVPSVNQVFKDNILLTLHYLDNTVPSSDKVDWSQVEQQPFHYQFTLNSGQVFAFHNDVLPEYQNEVIKTTNANFNYQQGFKSDGYLYGDGVCHLASLMDWVATDANLQVYAPTNHDFAVIPEISKQYGVSIYYSPGMSETNEKNNLYIKNDQNYPITFVFDYSNDQLKVSVVKDVS